MLEADEIGRRVIRLLMKIDAEAFEAMRRITEGEWAMSEGRPTQARSLFEEALVSAREAEPPAVRRTLTSFAFAEWVRAGGGR